jgi:TonB family protein
MIRRALFALACGGALAARAQEPDPEAPAAPSGTAPELVGFVEAPHPESESGRAAAVVLEIGVGPDGVVTDVVVVESAAAAFDDAAVTAARQFTFAPARDVDGNAVAARLLYRYAFTWTEVAATTATYAGTVTDGATGAPLAGVTVTLDDGTTTTTDAAGRFELAGVAPGLRTVVLRGVDGGSLWAEETLTAGQRTDVTYTVEPPSEDDDDALVIVIEAPTLARQAVSTEVSAEDARRVPGTQGDVLRVVESLPGVARASVGTGALVVWGAAPEDTGVYVDGVRVPRLYHDGGLRSILGSDFVKNVALVPGGYGAAYGRGTGGLVSVDTRAFDDVDGPHGSVAVDVYDASGSIRAPIGPRVVVAAAGRQGWVGPLLSAFYPDVEQFFPTPRYRDVQARVGVALDGAARVDLTWLSSADGTRRFAPSADPSRAASDERTQSFDRWYLRYTSEDSDGSATRAVAWIGRDATAQVARFGDLATSVEARTASFGLRASHRHRVGSDRYVEAGVDAEVSRAALVRAGSIAMPFREGDIRVFGQPAPDQINTDAWGVTSVNVAPYVEAGWSGWQDRLDVTAGARFEPFARSISQAAPKVGISPTNGLFLQDFHLEPRLSARLRPTATTRLTAAVGRYGQGPQAVDLSAAFGNPALPASTGAHAVLGGGITPAPSVSIDVTGFLTSASGLAMRNTADQPARAEALAPSGDARTVGAQLLARLDGDDGPYGWVSYTLSRSTRRDAPELERRLSDFDQTHVLTALGGVRVGSGFDAGVRVRVASGAPRTEVVGASYDSRRDLYQPLFGAHNDIRIPVFFQLDARVAQTLRFGAHTLDLSLDVQNVTLRQNVEEFIYNADYTVRDGIRGLPILPVLGVRWSG